MILLERRGASQVVGYDRILRQSRLQLVQRALGIEFDLIGDMKLQDLPRRSPRPDTTRSTSSSSPACSTTCSIHSEGSTTVRGMVREGGIMLVETVVAYDDSVAMHFNSRASSRPTGLWFFTPSLFDYLVRFVRLKPLDVVYIPSAPGEFGDRPAQGRMAIACRAISGSGRPSPTTIGSRARSASTSPSSSTGTRSPPMLPEVGYDDSREGLVRREDGSIDVTGLDRDHRGDAPPARTRRG